MELLGNLLNSDDLAAFLRQLRRRPGWMLRRFDPVASRRVRATWNRTAAPPVHFWDVPAVARRRVRLATGGEAPTMQAYIAQRHLRSDLRALSIGCGNGWRERLWADTGRFAAIRCVDVAEQQVAEAQRRYRLDPVLSFEVADAYALDVEPASLDVVIFEDSLHHLTPVDGVLARCREWLRPGGLLVVNEFVGPRRFQWTRRQLEAADAVLALLPERLRLSYAHGTLKRRVLRPSRLRMRMLDPSEAVESDAIRPAVERLFAVEETRPLGGTLVNLVLDDIAHHFVDGAADDWLELVFELEDRLIAAGEIESDYALLVARR